MAAVLLVGRDEVIFTKRASALVYWTIVNVGDAARQTIELKKRMMLRMSGELHLFEALLYINYLVYLDLGGGERKRL